MDMIKIGSFLAELRKEKNLTQEELGEQIGVTNKTVSRWENGNYLPPVEILQLLSKLYGVSINELLSGERLNDTAYKEKAEANIVTALNNSTATFNEKSRYYRKVWKKKHWIELTVAFICVFALLICGAIFENRLINLGGLLAIIYTWWTSSRMNDYIYRNLYNEAKKPEDKNQF